MVHTKGKEIFNHFSHDWKVENKPYLKVYGRLDRFIDEYRPLSNRCFGFYKEKSEDSLDYYRLDEYKDGELKYSSLLFIEKDQEFNPFNFDYYQDEWIDVSKLNELHFRCFFEHWTQWGEQSKIFTFEEIKKLKDVIPNDATEIHFEIW